jgi:hypothetical protein
LTLVGCLLGFELERRLFGDTTTVEESVEVGVLDIADPDPVGGSYYAKFLFTTGGDNLAFGAAGNTDRVAKMRNIASIGDEALVSAISFAEDAFGGGKTLLIANDDVVYGSGDGQVSSLLCAIAKGGDDINDAVAIHLLNVSGTAANGNDPAVPAIIKLDNGGGGKIYKFEALASTAVDDATAVVVGNSFAASVLESVSDFTFNASEATLDFTATSVAEGNGDTAMSSVFGVADVMENEVGNLNLHDWKLENIGNKSVFTASASSYSDSISTVFGIAKDSSENYGNGGYYHADVNGWKIGPFGNDVSLTSTAVATNGGTSKASVFGNYLGEDNESETEQQVEFQGSATIAALGYAGGDDGVATVNTLASRAGDVYCFNDLKGTSPSVVIAGLKLGENVSIADGKAKFVLADGENDAAAAVIFSNSNDNSSLNFGRMIGEAQGKSIGKGSASIIGAVLVGDKGAIAIDNGWEVNAFGPITGSETGKISIIEGALNLLASGNVDGRDKVFTSAIKQLEDNLSYSREKSNGGQTINELYQNGRGNRAGGVTVDASNFVSNGKLTLADTNSLVFGTDWTTRDRNNGGAFCRAMGIINASASVGGEAPISAANGWIAGFNDINYNENPITYKQGTNFWIIRVPYNKEITVGDVLDGCTLGDEFDGTYVQTEGGAEVAYNLEQNKIKLYKIKSNAGVDDYEATLMDGLTVSWEEGVNPQLFWMESEIAGGAKGLVYGDGILPAIPDAPAGERTAAAPAANMGAVTEVLDAAVSKLFDAMSDVRNDPFAGIFFSHGHQKEENGVGYDTNSYGALFGFDFVKSTKSGAMFKYGAAMSFAHGKTKFFGDGIGNSKVAKNNIYFGNVFGAYEIYSEKGLKTVFNATSSLGYAKTKQDRNDAGGNDYHADYGNSIFQLSGEVIKYLGTFSEVQVGPWLSAAYTRVHQKSYTESGDLNGIISSDGATFNKVATVIGLALEKEFQNPYDLEKRVRLFAKIGWRYEPVRSHSSGTVNIANLKPFTPEFGLSKKGSAVATIGFRNRISKNIEFSGSLNGSVNSKHSYISVNAFVGYSF